MAEDHTATSRSRAGIPKGETVTPKPSALRFSGAWVFRGTRIPVAEFVELFPGVSTDQAQQVLEQGWID